MTKNRGMALKMAALAAAAASFAWLWHELTIRHRRYLKNPPREIAGSVIRKYWDDYAKYMEIGTPRSHFFKLFPEPANAHSEMVCVWLYSDKQHRLAGMKPEDLTWRSLMGWSEGSCFVVFIDGKLATPVSNSGAFTVSGALAGSLGISLDKARMLVGEE